MKVFRRMKTGHSPGGSIAEVLGGQCQHPFPKISKANAFLNEGDCSSPATTVSTHTFRHTHVPTGL